MPGVACWHCAIENAVAYFRAIGNVDRVSNAKGMHRKLPWYKLACISNNIHEQVTLFVKGPAAIAKTIETDLQQCIGAAFTQLVRSASLNDGDTKVGAVPP